jgi:predicted nucleic acid-binding protein
MILVDSTLYINWLRARVDPTNVLADHLQRHDVFTCGIVRAEVLRGIVSPLLRERMAGVFDLMHSIPTDAQLWADVADLAWRLDRKGVVLPLTDVAIAACALRVGARIITTDRHFAKVPGLPVASRI